MTDHRTPDRIAVRGITAHAHHGVHGFERENGQTFAVDAVLDVDTAPAAATDDLALTVDYAELAQRLADVCLADERVDAVEITVHKPEAELGVPFDDVTVSIRRERRSR